ncbi:hypothetical protein CLU79DRAFT_754495 [Phycomyces nitens]|nr:hypothetical protein CLU79DRAFT_754495 [Phycomyces nitens]
MSCVLPCHSNIILFMCHFFILFYLPCFFLQNHYVCLYKEKEFCVYKFIYIYKKCGNGVQLSN